MKKYKTLIISTIICLIPLFVGLVMYNSFPDALPNKYDFVGNIEGYAPKAVMLISLPLILAVVNLSIHFMVHNTPLMQRQPKVVIRLLEWIIPLVSLFIFVFLLLRLNSTIIDPNKYIYVGIGFILIVIGNYMPKFKKNYYAGFKLPWTLDNENNWNKTHRMAGFLFVAGGILFIILSLFNLRVLGAVVLAIMFISPAVYSYLIYKKENENEKPIEK